MDEPFDPASRACTLPSHLKAPAGERSRRLEVLRAVADAVGRGLRVDEPELREALRISLCLVLGDTPEEEGLTRWLRVGQPVNPTYGHREAVGLLGALIAEDGGGISSALGLPPDPLALSPREVLAAAASYPAPVVAEAMRRADVTLASVGDPNKSWVAFYVRGDLVQEVSDALDAILGAPGKTPGVLPG